VEILSVMNSIVQYLRVHIITGVLVPGQKLNETELASRLKISRPPLREAFRILENDHLIVSIPRKGCYVAPLSIEDFQDIHEARVVLECASIDFLKEKGSRDLPKATLALEATRNLPFPNKSDPFEKFDYLKKIANFHIMLLESSDNSRIMRFYNSIFMCLARYQSMYVFIPGLMGKSQKDHEQILDLIKKGKYQKARELLKAHANSFVKYVGKALNERKAYSQVVEKG
jgi:DNA-binding GntR family transcriptional regulator